MDNLLNRQTNGGKAVTCRLMLADLPDDVLYLLLRYLDRQSLGRLSCVSRYFHSLTAQDFVWLRFAKDTFLIQQNDKVSRRKSCSLKERCRISKNWTDGVFKNVTLAPHNNKQLPWLQYSGSDLWFSTHNEIRCYSRRKGGKLKEDSRRRFCSVQSDVSKFALKGDKLVASYRDGSLCGWYTESGQYWFYYDRLHGTELQCVDFHENIVISGARDSTVTMLSIDPVYGKRDVGSIICEDRVWSLSISPDGSSFAVGTGGRTGDSALSLYNLHSPSKILDFATGSRRGAGVLDIQYDGPHTLLSCGYDTYLRLWDIRTGNCVSKWVEPFDSTLYCLRTDGSNVMLTGTARHGRTVLWDKRSTHYQQMYYCGMRSSPVYSLAFDQKNLFVALDLGLHLLDFTVY